MRRSKHGLITACICLLALTSIQCGQRGDLSERDSSTLTIHVPGQDERVLGPNGNSVWFLVFLGLAVDPEGTDDYQPRLLDRWDHTPDYIEWTVHLRDDVRWDDGVPVTAEDVKFSLELWTNPEIAYEGRWFEKITVLDSHTLQVTFSKPVTATILTYAWLPILPKHLLDALNVEQDQIFSWPFWKQPIGNGPYRYARNIPGVMTEVTANPDYYGEQPSIPTVVLRFGGNVVAELLSGNVDVASDITPSEAVQLASDPRFQVYHQIRYSQHIAIVWNHRNSLFRDAAVRRALTMSIDRRELNRILNYPDDLPIFDVPLKTRHFAQGLVPDPLPFDPERASQLLASAGWVDTNNDGVLEKDGQEFLFTLSINERESAQAIYIQDQLRRAGISMEIATYDRSSLHEKTDISHNFDAAIVDYWYLEGLGTFRRSGYDNPEASRLRDAAWFTIDQEEVDRHLADLWKIFEEDIPVTYLHPRIFFLAAHQRVKGMQNNRPLFSNVENLWFEDEQ